MGNHGNGQGHLFIIDGDLTKIRVDAVLVPTDVTFNVERPWHPLLVDGWRQRVGQVTESWDLRQDPVRSKDGPRIWFANIGHIADEVGPYVDVAERFVRAASDAVLHDAGRAAPARPPLLALNALGTGKGGLRSVRGTLILELVRRLTTLVSELPVDVVLVTWGLKQYAAARRAQRLLRESPDAPMAPAITVRPDVAEAIERLANETLLQRLVLFVGAGASMGAALPDWDTLIARVAEAAGSEIDIDRLAHLDARDQAQVLMLSMGETQYRDQIVAELTTDRYGLTHGLLASLDPHEVVTTNYDVLLEEAYGSARAPAVLPQHHVGPDGRWILKLHGTITQPESIILARQDYLGLPERSAALFGILQAMLMTKHMLFVGYSLTDDTFHRVMHDVRRSRGASSAPVGTALTLFTDPVLEQLWGDVLTFVPMTERPTEVGADDKARAARQLEIVLDEIAIRAADVSAFLLDHTYDGVLGAADRAIRDSAGALLKSTGTDRHIGKSVRNMLMSLTRPDPKDHQGR